MDHVFAAGWLRWSNDPDRVDHAVRLLVFEDRDEPITLEIVTHHPTTFALGVLIARLDGPAAVDQLDH
jgi:hypothetical protein